ncbi:MAG: ABC transporter ATP-binding protein [Pseudomonadota bacterium]
MAAAAIQARGIHKHYGLTRALDGIDIDIERGQVCAMLGQNGAGKTTFIHSVLGLTPVDRGELVVLGHTAGSRAARQRLGVMLQDTDLPDLLTGREHLARFASYYDQPLAIDGLIESADLGDFVDKKYKAMSGGQKRRIQFAVALIGQPDVLFLDEPTTGLDREAREAVWNSVRALVATGTTVILTTHYLEEADALADRIVLIHAGQIVADDAADRIRAQVGGSLISCETSLDDAAIQALPAVRSIQRGGRLVRILTDHAPTCLAALLAADPGVDDLTVTKPSLSEAVAALTQTGDKESSS